MSEPLEPMSRIPIKQKTNIGNWLVGSICLDAKLERPIANAVGFTIELPEGKAITAVFRTPEEVDEAISLLSRHRNHVWVHHKPNIQS